MVGVSRYTVAEYLRRATVVGITWSVPAALDDLALERGLFTPPFTPQTGRPRPELARIHAELRKPSAPSCCSGRNNAPGNQMAMATAGSAISHATGAVAYRPPCDRATRPGSGYSSAMPRRR